MISKLWHRVGFHLGRLSRHPFGLVSKGAYGAFVALTVFLQNYCLFVAVACVALAVRRWEEPATSGAHWISNAILWLNLWFTLRERDRYTKRIHGLHSDLAASQYREKRLLAIVDPRALAADMEAMKKESRPQ